jgi:hypothetical protein
VPKQRESLSREVAVRRRIQHAIILILGFATTLLYQNCSPSTIAGSQGSSSQQAASSGSNLSGNGTVYDGKVYRNQETNGQCADGSPFRSEIKIESGYARLTRDECKDVVDQPVLDVSKLGLYPHNESNLIFKQHVFDEETKSKDVTVYLCRSHYKMKFVEGERRVIGDFLLRTDSSQRGLYKSQIKFGIYNYAMKLVAPPFDSGEIGLAMTKTKKDDHGYNVYSSAYSVDGKNYQSKLELRMDNLEGWLEVSIAGQPLPTNPISVTEPPQFGFRVLCYPQ